MARNNGLRHDRRGRLLTFAVVAVAAVGLTSLYLVRSSEPDMTAGGSTSSSVADLPAQPLTKEGYTATGRKDGDTLVVGADADAVAEVGGAVPDDQSGATGSPSAEPTGVEPSTPDETGGSEQPGQTVTLWLDGWSKALLGDATVAVIDPSSKQAARVTFTPLTADQLRDAAVTDPEVVASYLARLTTSSSDVTCDAGRCTVDGEPVDPGLLDDLAAVPGLGAVYQGNGIDHGVWVARVAVADPKVPLLVRGPGGDVELDPGSPVDEEGPSAVTVPPSAANGFHRGSWPLAYGLGRMFPVDVAWIAENPTAYRVSGSLTTGDPVRVSQLFGQPLLVTSIADPSAAPAVDAFSDSLMTYLTSPTTGCGSTVLCTPERVTPSLSDTKNAYTTACWKEPTNGNPRGRVVLGAQIATVTVDTKNPVLMLGNWNAPKTGTVLGFDATRATATSGRTEFRQQAVFLADDEGLRDITGVRNLPPLTFTDDKVFGGAFVGCE